MSQSTEIGAVPAVTVQPGGLVANLRGVYIIWYRDVLRYLRDRLRLVSSLAQPVLYLLVFGTGLGSSLGSGRFRAGIRSYNQFLFAGVIGLAILFTAMFSAVSIVWDREFGFLKEIFVAPIKRWVIALGKTLGGATQAMIQGVIILVLAPVAKVHLSPATVVVVFGLILAIAFSLTSAGLAISSRMKSMQSFQGVVNFFMMPLFFLSGALFPLRGLPAWMTVLNRLDPLAYGVDAIRKVILVSSGVPSSAAASLGVTLGGHPLSVVAETAVVVAFGLAMLWISILNFRVRD